MAPPMLDSFGRVVAAGGEDKWTSRCGIALALNKLSPHLTADKLDMLFTFYLETTLADRRADVQQAMLEAALMAINDHGKVIYC